MLPAKYQLCRHGGSGKEVIKMVFTIYGHGYHLAFPFMVLFYLYFV